MWVFGYGSLMGDGWEKLLNCEHRGVAILHGYQRVFNKASVRNWGSPRCQCLTLNLEQHVNAMCVGIAFSFAEARSTEVLGVLEKREGKGFNFARLPVSVRGVGEVLALVPIYVGKNIVADADVAGAIRNMRSARGTSGACIDYVRNIQELLTSLGIEDPAVQRVWDQVAS